MESSEPKHDFFKLLPQQVDCVVSKLGSPNIVKLFCYVGFLNLQGFGLVVSKLGSPNIVKLFWYVGFLNLQGFGVQI